MACTMSPMSKFIIRRHIQAKSVGVRVKHLICFIKSDPILLRYIKPLRDRGATMTLWRMP